MREMISRMDKQPFPTNRIVAFLGPQIAWIAGLVATWLVTQFPGLNLDSGKTAGILAQAITFLVVTAVTWAGQQSWMQGWKADEARRAEPVMKIGPGVSITGTPQTTLTGEFDEPEPEGAVQDKEGTLE